MTQLQAMAGIPPAALLNFLSRQNAYQSQQDRQSGNQQMQMLMEFLRQGRDANSEARNANESRYGDILQLLGMNRERTLDGLENFGQSLTDDANKRWDVTRNNLLGDLAARGMPGSTRRAVAEGTATEGRGKELNRISDMLTDRRLSADERFTDKATGVMERRTDAYPDLSGVAGMAGQLGRLPMGRTNVSGIPATGTKPSSGAHAMGGIGIGPGANAPQAGHRAFGFSGGFGNQATGAPIFRMPTAPTGPTGPQMMNPSEQDRERQNSLFAAAQADQGLMGNSRNNAAINSANLQALRQGHAGYQPGQTAPTIPGAAPSLMNGNFDAGGSQLAPFLQQLLQGGGQSGATEYANPNSGRGAAYDARRAREQQLLTARNNVMPGVASRKRQRQMNSAISSAAGGLNPLFGMIYGM